MTSDVDWVPGHLEHLSTEESLTLAASRPIGRISYCTDLGPVTIPVNHRVIDGDIYLLTSPASGWLRPLSQGSQVCFEVDDIDEFFHYGWSVLIHGPVCAPELGAFPADKELPKPWAGGERTFLIKIRTERVTGRRVMEA